VVANAEGEPSKFKENIEDHAQDESPQKDAEADANAERAEV
jgi:hypothetical protein